VPAPYQPRTDRASDPLDPALLRSAFLRALARAPVEPEPTQIGAAPYTVAEALALVRQALDDLESVRFGHLVAPDASRQRHVATFLAILEIARLGLAQVTQAERFGEIVVRPPPRPLSTDGGEAS
jgi:segregation and condensation protein A